MPTVSPAADEPPTNGSTATTTVVCDEPPEWPSAKFASIAIEMAVHERERQERAGMLLDNGEPKPWPARNFDIPGSDDLELEATQIGSAKRPPQQILTHNALLNAEKLGIETAGMVWRRQTRDASAATSSYMQNEKVPPPPRETPGRARADVPLRGQPPRHNREVVLPVRADFTWPYFEFIALCEHSGEEREAYAAVLGAPTASVADRRSILPPSTQAWHFIGDVKDFLAVYPHSIPRQSNHATCGHANWACWRTWPEKIKDGSMLQSAEDLLYLSCIGDRSLTEQPPTAHQHSLGPPTYITNGHEHGAPSKTYYMWARNMPCLPPTDIVPKEQRWSELTVIGSSEEQMVLRSYTPRNLAMAHARHGAAVSGGDTSDFGRPAATPCRQYTEWRTWLQHSFALFSAHYAPAISMEWLKQDKRKPALILVPVAYSPTHGACALVSLSKTHGVFGEARDTTRSGADQGEAAAKFITNDVPTQYAAPSTRYGHADSIVIVPWAKPPLHVATTPAELNTARAAGLCATWCTLPATSEHDTYHALGVAFERVGAITTTGAHGAQRPGIWATARPLVHFRTARAWAAQPKQEYREQRLQRKAFLEIEAKRGKELRNYFRNADNGDGALIAIADNIITAHELQQELPHPAGGLPNFGQRLLRLRPYAERPLHLHTSWLARLPPQQLPAGFRPRAYDEIVAPWGRRIIAKTIDNTRARDLECWRHGESTRPRPKYACIGSGAGVMVPHADGVGAYNALSIVYDLDFETGLYGALDYQRAGRTHWVVEMIRKVFGTHDDHQLMSLIMHGVRWGVKPPMHIRIAPNLERLDERIHGVSVAFRKLIDKGLYWKYRRVCRADESISPTHSPFITIPAYIVGVGGTDKPDNPDEKRIVGDQGAPHEEQAVRERNHPHGDPDGPELTSMNDMMGPKPSAATRGKLLDAARYPMPHPEKKPRPRQIYSDQAVLSHFALLADTYVAGVKDDGRHMFFQFEQAPEEERTCQFLILIMLPRVGPSGEVELDSNGNCVEELYLVLIVATCMNMGSRNASKIAQRFTDRLLEGFSQQLDEYVRETWLPTQKPALRKLLAERADKIGPRHARPFITAGYSDDYYFAYVGPELAAAGTRLWRDIASKTNFWLSTKSGAGTVIDFIGGRLVLNGGFGCLPPSKHARAVADTIATLEGRITRERLESHNSFLVHVTDWLDFPEGSLKGLSAPLKIPGTPEQLAVVGKVAHSRYTATLDLLNTHTAASFWSGVDEAPALRADGIVGTEGLTFAPRLTSDSCSDVENPYICGCAAGLFFRFPLTGEWKRRHITLTEACGTVLCLVIFPKYFPNHELLVESDATASLSSIEATSRSSDLIYLRQRAMRDPTFATASRRTWCTHCKGWANGLSDAGSRDQMDIMRDLADAFGIRLQEVPIPPEAARLMNDVLANTTPSQPPNTTHDTSLGTHNLNLMGDMPVAEEDFDIAFEEIIDLLVQDDVIHSQLKAPSIHGAWQGEENSIDLHGDRDPIVMLNTRDGSASTPCTSQRKRCASVLKHLDKVRTCESCGRTEGEFWRHGFNKTCLCNACGQRETRAHKELAKYTEYLSTTSDKDLLTGQHNTAMGSHNPNVTGNMPLAHGPLGRLIDMLLAAVANNEPVETIDALTHNIRALVIPYKNHLTSKYRQLTIAACLVVRQPYQYTSAQAAREYDVSRETVGRWANWIKAMLLAEQPAPTAPPSASQSAMETQPEQAAAHSVMEPLAHPPPPTAPQPAATQAGQSLEDLAIEALDQHQQAARAARNMMELLKHPPPATGDARGGHASGSTSRGMHNPSMDGNMPFSQAQATHYAAKSGTRTLAESTEHEQVLIQDGDWRFIPVIRLCKRTADASTALWDAERIHRKEPFQFGRTAMAVKPENVILATLENATGETCAALWVVINNDRRNRTPERTTITILRIVIDDRYRWDKSKGNEQRDIKFELLDVIAAEVSGMVNPTITLANVECVAGERNSMWTRLFYAMEGLERGVVTHDGAIPQLHLTPHPFLPNYANHYTWLPDQPQKVPDWLDNGRSVCKIEPPTFDSDSDDDGALLWGVPIYNGSAQITHPPPLANNEVEQISGHISRDGEGAFVSRDHDAEMADEQTIVDARRLQMLINDRSITPSTVLRWAQQKEREAQQRQHEREARQQRDRPETDVDDRARGDKGVSPSPPPRRETPSSPPRACTGATARGRGNLNIDGNMPISHGSSSSMEHMAHADEAPTVLGVRETQANLGLLVDIAATRSRGAFRKWKARTRPYAMAELETDETISQEGAIGYRKGGLGDYFRLYWHYQLHLYQRLSRPLTRPFTAMSRAFFVWQAITRGTKALPEALREWREGVAHGTAMKYFWLWQRRWAATILDWYRHPLSMATRALPAYGANWHNHPCNTCGKQYVTAFHRRQHEECAHDTMGSHRRHEFTPGCWSGNLLPLQRWPQAPDIATTAASPPRGLRRSARHKELHQKRRPNDLPGHTSIFADAGGDTYAECAWWPQDGVIAGQFLDHWISAAQRASTPAHLGAILTFVHDPHGRWRPLTIAWVSCIVPNEWGLFAAVDAPGGTLLGTMLDGKDLGSFATRAQLHAAAEAIPTSEARYLIEFRGRGRNTVLIDGSSCRPGGPRCANDPRGTNLSANAQTYDNGCLNVAPRAEIPRLRPEATASQRRRSEILHNYGEAYWRRHAPPDINIASEPRSSRPSTSRGVHNLNMIGNMPISHNGRGRGRGGRGRGRLDTNGVTTEQGHGPPPPPNTAPPPSPQTDDEEEVVEIELEEAYETTSSTPDTSINVGPRMTGSALSGHSYRGRGRGGRGHRRRLGTGIVYPEHGLSSPPRPNLPPPPSPQEAVISHADDDEEMPAAHNTRVNVGNLTISMATNVSHPRQDITVVGTRVTPSIPVYLWVRVLAARVRVALFDEMEAAIRKYEVRILTPRESFHDDANVDSISARLPGVGIPIDVERLVGINPHLPFEAQANRGDPHQIWPDFGLPWVNAYPQSSTSTSRGVHNLNMIGNMPISHGDTDDSPEMFVPGRSPNIIAPRRTRSTTPVFMAAAAGSHQHRGQVSPQRGLSGTSPPVHVFDAIRAASPRLAERYANQDDCIQEIERISPRPHNRSTSPQPQTAAQARHNAAQNIATRLAADTSSYALNRGRPGLLHSLVINVADATLAGIPHSTAGADEWGFKWVRRFATAMGIAWMRPHTANTADEILREVWFTSMALFWIGREMSPSERRRKAGYGQGLPTSALLAIYAFHRVMRDCGRYIPDMKDTRRTLKGLCMLYKRQWGDDAFIPMRKQPFSTAHLVAIVSALTTGGIASWSASLTMAFLTVFCYGISTGVRKDEWTTGFEFDTYLRRGNFSWVDEDDPMVDLTNTPEVINSRRNGHLLRGRSTASKCDRLNIEWGARDMWFRLDDTNPLNFAYRWKQWELAYPCPTTERNHWPAFSPNGNNVPFTSHHADACTRRVIATVMEAAEAALRSWHSCRVTIATRLFRQRNRGIKRDEVEGVIQSLVRWKTPESMRLYARTDPHIYAGYVDLATNPHDEQSGDTETGMPAVDPESVVEEAQTSMEALDADNKAAQKRAQSRTATNGQTDKRRKRATTSGEPSASAAPHVPTDKTFDIGDDTPVAHAGDESWNIIGCKLRMHFSFWDCPENEKAPCTVVGYIGEYTFNNGTISKHTYVIENDGFFYPARHTAVRDAIDDASTKRRLLKAPSVPRLL